MRNYKTEGIIIRRINYSEADRILTIFTKHYGKIKVIAKGVRRITSKRGGNVELFNYAQISLHEGKNFDILTEASVTESFGDLKNDLKKIAWGYHICELVDGLCPERQENRKIFDFLYQTLLKLNKIAIVFPNAPVNKDDDNIVHSFELFLLRELGFWPRDKDIPDNSQNIIEEILEKKLKSKSFLKKIGQ